MSDATQRPMLSELFPESSRLLLTGGGKEFIERVGVEAARQVVLGVMKGENVRSQTEPLSRRRIAQVSGAMVAMFVKGWSEIENFNEQLSDMAAQQLRATRRNDRARVWPAQMVATLLALSPSTRSIAENNVYRS